MGDALFPSFPSGEADGNRCGTAVDIFTNFLPTSPIPIIAVTGCPGFDSGKGVVRTYEFDGNDWNVGTDISASNGANGDSFGSAVALAITCDFIPPITFSCTPRLAVGAPNKAHGSAILGGALYVYAGGSTWNETDIFTHVSPTSFAATFFGISMDMNGSQLITGSPGAFTTECGTAPRCGRTIRWERSGSSWNSTVGGGAVNLGGTPPGEQVGMQFGRSVALGFDNWIAIGAPMTDGPAGLVGTYEGLGLVELRRESNGDWGNGWGDSRAELRPESFSISLNYDDSRFGTSVAFGDERWLAVGVPHWPQLVLPGPSQTPRGQVWMYAEPDGVFSDRFEK